MSKRNPCRDLEFELKRLGHSTRELWVIRGPKDTGIAWMHCFICQGLLVIVQTYREGGINVFLQTYAIAKVNPNVQLLIEQALHNISQEEIG